MTGCPLPPAVFDGVIDVSHHNGTIDWPAVAAGRVAGIAGRSVWLGGRAELIAWHATGALPGAVPPG